MSLNPGTGLGQMVVPEPDGQPQWLQKIRRHSIQWVAQHGFPGRDDEDWKYTRIGPLLAIPFEPARASLPTSMSFSDLDSLVGNFGGPRLVFVNGFFNPEWSSLTQIPENLLVMALQTRLHQEEESNGRHLFPPPNNAFTALNSALTEDGAYIEVPANLRVTTPIHLVFIADAGADAPALLANPRSVVIAGTNSHISLVESYIGLSPRLSLTNAVTELVLEQGAQVEHYTVQNESEAAIHLGLVEVHQQQDSRFYAHVVSLGSSLARHEVRVALAGEGAETQLQGLYMPRGKQHHSHVTTIDHQSPGCTSRELYKGVLEGRSRAVFKGQVIVRQGADRTDASQTNKNLLLSEGAEIDTRPQLEILADDVKCTHGAAVGQLDEDAVFYLRSRGIPDKEARDMLTYAFVTEMLESLALPALRTLLEHSVARQLSRESTGP